MEQTCSVSGTSFTVTDEEMQQRAHFGLQSPPSTAPEVRIRHIGAFWPHFYLHERNCDKSGKRIVSVFREDCPYPVWHKDDWMNGTNPPEACWDSEKEFFPQLWELFTQCPIAHNMGVGNDNCEYTDDWWYSRNCYLCHSGFECEDLSYCYRARKCRDCRYTAFATESELCVDIINVHKCFNVQFALNCQQLTDCSFVYDCRNCQDCMFCFNLRNKQYCFGNQQLTKEQYEQKRAEWNLASRSVYQRARENFGRMMTEQVAWHRALSIDRSEACTGNFIDHSKGLINCYFMDNSEDCINCVRSVSGDDKTCLDSLGHFGGQLLCNSAIAQDRCYEILCCFNVIQSKNLQYSANCYQCEHCFGCCGLKGKKYCIFNKEYSPEEYERIKSEIIAHLQSTGEYGTFFPGYFSPMPYDESWSAVHFPLERAQQESLGFRVPDDASRTAPAGAADASDVPDTTELAGASTLQTTFWDAKVLKPFRISEADIAFAKKTNTPLPEGFYSKRLVENFRWMHYNGANRKTVCAKSNVAIETSWPEAFDGRIVSEEEYLKIIA